MKTVVLEIDKIQQGFLWGYFNGQAYNPSVKETTRDKSRQNANVLFEGLSDEEQKELLKQDEQMKQGLDVFIKANKEIINEEINNLQQTIAENLK